MILLFRIRMGADSNKLTYVPRNTYILIKDLSAELRRTSRKMFLLDISKETEILYILQYFQQLSLSLKLDNNSR